MNKPTKPTDLVPRSFGGVKNNFSTTLQTLGYEDNIPAILGGDNLNYQLNAVGKELDYCEKICDYINSIPINKTPVVDANNKLVYTQYDIRVYNATETYYENDYLSGFVNGEKHIYRCKQNGVQGQSLDNETYFERVDIMGNVKTIGRNIGEIVTSTIPLTDAGLHLLDGALIDGNGSYGDFVDYVAELASNHSELFTTEAIWQSSVNQYGVCGKFVYNSTNNTVRLPKYSNKIYTKNINSTAPVVGNGMALGLTNGTELRGLGSLAHNAGAGVGIATGHYGSPIGDTVSATFTNTGTHFATGVTLDATKSGIIAQLSNITASVDGYYYIVVATLTKTDIEVDIDEIAADLNGKADVDLSNCTRPYLIETYIDGTSGYNIWSNGYCEQWGFATIDGTISFLKEFVDTNYYVLVSNSYTSTGTSVASVWKNKTTTSVDIDLATSSNGTSWKVGGYLAEGEY